MIHYRKRASEISNVENVNIYSTLFQDNEYFS